MPFAEKQAPFHCMQSFVAPPNHSAAVLSCSLHMTKLTPARNTTTGVTFLGAIPVGLIVRDSNIISAFSTACVGFMVTFGLLVGVIAFLPAPVQGGA